MAASSANASAGVDVPLPELVDLLGLCVESAKTAIVNLRFDPYDTTDRFLVALLQAILEYARGVIIAAKNETYALIPGGARSALDAYVDICNLCDHPEYWKHLDAADSSAWLKVLEAASQGKNPFLKDMSESELLVPGRRHYSGTKKVLEADGIRKMDNKERFAKAGLRNELESFYALLSADVHNNVSDVVNRFFDIQDDRIVLREQTREHTPTPHFELPCTLTMAEIVLRATEKILKRCRHGVAVLAEADTRFLGIARRVSGTPADGPRC